VQQGELEWNLPWFLCADAAGLPRRRSRTASSAASPRGGTPRDVTLDGTRCFVARPRRRVAGLECTTWVGPYSINQPRSRLPDNHIGIGTVPSSAPLLQFRPALMIRLNLDTLYIFFFSVVNIMLALQESVTRVGSSNGISVQISQDINNFFFDKERLQRKPHNYRFY
jgi:hypothetical protein